MSFADDVYAQVQKIPYGTVATYGQIALLAGRPRAARVVGAVLSRNPFGSAVPWHRVLRADGSLATGGTLQQVLLEAEGVFVLNNKVLLTKFQWNSYENKGGSQ